MHLTYIIIMMSRNNSQEFVTLEEYFNAKGYDIVVTDHPEGTMIFIKEVKKE